MIVHCSHPGCSAHVDLPDMGFLPPEAWSHIYVSNDDPEIAYIPDGGGWFCSPHAQEIEARVRQAYCVAPGRRTRKPRP